jgi:hypothetical protein
MTRSVQGIATATLISALLLQPGAPAGLAQSRSSDAEILLLLRHGAAFFPLPATLVLGDAPGRSLAAGDFDGDGHVDIAISDRRSGSAQFLRADGSGVALDARDSLSSRQTVVAHGDFDGDGVNDRAVARELTGTVLDFGRSTRSGPAAVALADFDANGTPDAAVVDGLSRAVRVLLTDKGARVSSTSAIPTPAAPAFVAAADFNADSLLDLAVASDRSNDVWILAGDGQGGFSRYATVTAAAGSESSAVTASTVDASAYEGVASLVLNPSTISGGSGASSTATITLNAPAPPEGVVVTITSSNTDLAASVPSVTVPAGATSITVPVATNALYRRNSGLAFSVTITAAHGGTGRSATLNVTAQPRPPAFPSGLKGDRTGQMCGGDVPFPGDPGILYDCAKGPNPGTSGLCSFRQECTFGCRNLPDDGLKMRATCATAPPFPITLSSKLVVGGRVSEGVVTLSAPAPDLSGTEYLLTSNHSAALPVPWFTQRIAGGTTTLPFTVSTNAVDTPQFAQIAVDLHTADFVSSRTALSWLAIVPGSPPLPPLASLTIQPASVVGGQSTTGTVTLAGPAPMGGAEVSVYAGGSSGFTPPHASAPRVVVIPEGATSATFTITTTPVSMSEFASVVAAFGGTWKEAALEITTPPPAGGALSTLTLNPSTLVGGQTGQGTVTISVPAPAGGAVVALSSEAGAGPHVVSVPASVTVPAGETSATFAVTTQPVTQAAASTIRATYNGSTLTALQNVSPGLALSSVSLNPATVVGGNTSQGTVTLTTAAPSGGAVVSLSSSNPGVASVPASVTVPAGSSGASFTISTTAVSASTSAVISAAFDGVTRTATLTVTPPAAPGPLPAPTLLSPAVDARFAPGQAITFDWTDVSGAASYTIQIDDTETFSTPLVATATTVPSQFTTSTLPTTRMWWRVRANDPAGNPGAWSAVRRFEVKN